MHNDIFEDLAEARNFIEGARGTSNDLDEETLRDAAEWIEFMATQSRPNRPTTEDYRQTRSGDETPSDFEGENRPHF